MQLLSILVVDEDDSCRNAVGKMLRDRGHRVTLAATVASALSTLRAVRFDVVLTDVLIGEDDGLAVIKTARSSQPDARIVAMSGGGEFLTASYCLNLAVACGALASLAKPFTHDELIHLVEGVTA